MTTKGLLLCGLLALATGCSTQAPRTTEAGEWITPYEAIQAAAASPGRGVSGEFALTVRNTGKTRNTHLNSEDDYRDPRNLSISIAPRAAEVLAAQLGAPPETALRGKPILVTGTARRVRIDFLVGGRPSGKYYYQTHVDVTDASQIRLR